jgi:hypothetical protein
MPATAHRTHVWTRTEYEQMILSDTESRSTSPRGNEYRDRKILDNSLRITPLRATGRPVPVSDLIP